MRVKFLKSMQFLTKTYEAGQTYEIGKTFAALVIKAGVAQATEEAETLQAQAIPSPKVTRARRGCGKCGRRGKQ